MADQVTESAPPEASGGPAAEYAARLRAEIAGLNRELAEIEMLVGQARNEAARHEAKRSGLSDKLAAWSPAAGTDPRELLEIAGQLVTLTRRAAVMEAQIDVLEGKRRALGRFRDALASHATELAGLAGTEPAPAPPPPVEPPTLSRVVLAAQEDLRREIARAMHDGPAQSLTNIVLQAQIVEQLMARDPEQAKAEVRLLVSMVQQTLDATKSFIFDVRPMVLDDLGLVPTLRRAARDRGRRAQVPVNFDSIGQDRRLPMELESGLFRMLDEALAAFLDAAPERVSIRLDWGDRLTGHVAAFRAVPETPAPAAPTPGPDMPAALAAMIEDRRAGAVAAARVELPPAAWREIAGRAATIGVTAELLADGSELRLVADVAEGA